MQPTADYKPWNQEIVKLPQTIPSTTELCTHQLPSIIWIPTFKTRTPLTNLEYLSTILLEKSVWHILFLFFFLHPWRSLFQMLTVLPCVSSFLPMRSQEKIMTFLHLVRKKTTNCEIASRSNKLIYCTLKLPQ